jgi:hypothetical protein
MKRTVEIVNEIQVKSILNKHKKRDEWFLDDYSINPFLAILSTVFTAT